MTEFLETIKNNPKPQKILELIAKNYRTESYRTQTQIWQNGPIHL